MTFAFRRKGFFLPSRFRITIASNSSFLNYLELRLHAMEVLIIVGVCLIVLFILFKIFKAFIKWGIIIVILLFVVAYFTNPEELTHHQSLKETVKQNITEKLVKIDDYKIFSLTKVKVKGEEKIVGIGAFGKVWYFDDIEKRLKK
jgi:hypothetical protein